MKGRFWPRNKVELQGKIPINRNKSVEILLDYEQEEKLDTNTCVQVKLSTFKVRGRPYIT